MKDDFQKYLEKQLKNPEFKWEWMKLEPLYHLLKMKIIFKKIFKKNNAKGIISGSGNPQNNTILGNETPQNRNGGDK